MSKKTGNTEGVEQQEAEQPKERKKKVIISAAEYWKFAAEKPGDICNGSEFLGRYIGEIKREKDGAKADVDPSHKAGAVIGFEFEQLETGEHFIISNSHAIEKALEKTGYNTDLDYCIEFLGKGLTSSKQPYNRFEVSVLE